MLIELFDQLVTVGTVNRTGLLNALPAGSGAAETMHTDLKKVFGGGAVKVKNFTDPRGGESWCTISW